MSVLYAEFKGSQQFLGVPTPIPNLSLAIPEGANEMALVILNVPASWAVIASWTSGRGGRFNISVDGVTLPEYAEYDYLNAIGSQNMPVRVPATLVVAVPMLLKTQKVVGLASNCIIDSSASLSVIVLNQSQSRVGKGASSRAVPTSSQTLRMVGTRRYAAALPTLQSYSAASRCASAGSTLAAQNLNSGIFPNGSSFGLVSRFAAAST